MSTADLGLIGLAVMGQNLVLNFTDHGYRVAVYNRTTRRTTEFLDGPARGTTVVGAETLEQLVGMVSKPRRIILMVKAGPAVDHTLEALVPLLDPGDVVVDGGNSHPADTGRRVSRLGEEGVRYLGVGVSGGEFGARWGPSIMPGGDPEGWPLVETMLKSIAARVADGTPCCDWIGPGGAGHYTKMVHNGIEYGDMQVIAEAYHLMKAVLGMGEREMAQVFRSWGNGVLDSYLISITADILDHVDENGEPTVRKILDAAAQKGTGKWTVISSLDLGYPLGLVAEAVYARVVSALVELRHEAAEQLGSAVERNDDLGDQFVRDIRDALYASKIVSYAQGFMLLSAAADAFGWKLDYGRIARLWREGCIIRAVFLDDISEAFGKRPDLPNLLLDPFFAEAVRRAEPGWRRVVATGIQAGVPLPAYASALAFYDSLRSRRLPADLIQAQRDYFGAHTYERIDHPRGRFFHTDWTGPER